MGIRKKRFEEIPRDKISALCFCGVRNLIILDSLGNNERENNLSVLGMQKHSEYLLNSLSNDNEKVREVFSTNLWNDFSKFKNDNSEFVELFINNHHVGLYSLG